MMFNRHCIKLLGWVLLEAFSVRGQPGLTVGERPGGPFQYHLPDDTTAIMAIIRTGESLMTKKPDSATVLFMEALQKSRENSYAYGAASALCNLGKVFTTRNVYDKAQEAFQASITYAVRSEKGHTLLPFIYGNISWMYALQGKFEPAAQYMFHLASFAEKYRNPHQRANIYSNIAGILASLPEPYQSSSRQQALYYCDMAQQNARLADEKDMLATTMLNMADIYVRDKNWEMAHLYLDTALQLSRVFEFGETEHNVLLTYGELYLAQGMAQKALPYLLSAGSVGKNKEVNPYYKVPEAINLGKAYFLLGQYTEAEAYLEEAGNRANQLRLVRPEIDEILSGIYTAQGQPQQALDHYRRYIQKRDSLVSRQTMGNIHDLETRYRTAQKDKTLAEKQLQIKMQQRQLEQKNIWIAWALVGALILTGLLIAAFKHHRNRQKLQRERIRNLQQQQELLHKENEINQLKAMMTGEEKERQRIAQELHDGIGGMLAAINMHFNVARKAHNQFAGMNELNQIMQMVEETTDEVRKTAHNLMPSILMQYNFTEALHAYCNQVTVDNGLQIDLHLPEVHGHLEKGIELVLFRIIQELIQNIIKHAQATHAIIEMEEYNNLLSITVEDNGVGFDKATQKNGFGLQNLQFRVKALQGVLLIESEKNGGTSVHIKFDVNKLNRNPAIA